MPVVDFCEELHIKRHVEFSNNVNESLLLYDYCWSKTDLADDTVQVLEFKDVVPLSDVVKVIESFEVGLKETKEGIKALLNNDHYDGKDYY